MERDGDGGGVRDETKRQSKEGEGKKTLPFVMPKCWNSASSVHHVRKYGDQRRDVRRCNLPVLWIANKKKTYVSSFVSLFGGIFFFFFAKADGCNANYCGTMLVSTISLPPSL